MVYELILGQVFFMGITQKVFPRSHLASYDIKKRGTFTKQQNPLKSEGFAVL